MRIFYYLSHYISHYLAGLEYVSLLRELGHTVATNLAEEFATNAPVAAIASFSGQLSPQQHDFLAQADLVILHQEPHLLPDIYAQLPLLRKKRVIAYAVWETDKLPPAFIAPLQSVSAVWTCSEFCRAVIAPHVRYCAVLPHMVRLHPIADADRHWAEDILADSRQAGAFVFFSVINVINPRKNLYGLLETFNRLRLQSGVRLPVRLLLKQYRKTVTLTNLPDILTLSENLSPGRMAALYQQCDAYVSAHHAEGWGLGLAEAMSYGKPVIATGYSGNMEYMNQENSFPIPFTLTSISRYACQKLSFHTPDMHWAAPDLIAFARTMRRVAEKRYDPTLRERAAAIAERFGPARIGEILTRLLTESATGATTFTTNYGTADYGAADYGAADCNEKNTYATHDH